MMISKNSSVNENIFSVVLDTNVLIAAYLDKGLAYDVLKLAQKGSLDLYVSLEILQELGEKLVKKFRVEKDDLEEYLKLINECSSLVVPRKKIRLVKNDPDDNKILECAVEANASLIITMDRDLLKLKSYQKIGIVHPKTLTWILPELF